MRELREIEILGRSEEIETKTAGRAETEPEALKLTRSACRLDLLPLRGGQASRRMKGKGAHGYSLKVKGRLTPYRLDAQSLRSWGQAKRAPAIAVATNRRCPMGIPGKATPLFEGIAESWTASKISQAWQTFRLGGANRSSQGCER